MIFFLANSVTVNDSESEKFEQQTNRQPYDLQRVDNSARQNEIIESNIDS